MSSLPAAPSSPSLLIVDDDPDIRHALQDLLEHEGYLVQSVSTGQEALARVTQQHFHAMILDVGLPDQDGLSLLPVVKEADPLVTVVMISAHVTKEQKAQALRLGAFAWLDKPYSREELKALLRGAIGPAASPNGGGRTEAAPVADRAAGIVGTDSGHGVVQGYPQSYRAGQSTGGRIHQQDRGRSRGPVHL